MGKTARAGFTFENAFGTFVQLQVHGLQGRIAIEGRSPDKAS